MQSVPSPQYDATAMVLMPPLKSPSSQTAFEEFPFEWLPMPQVLLHKDAVAANGDVLEGCDGGEGSDAAQVRMPQSVQSVPHPHNECDEYSPPSSHSLSERCEQVSSHVPTEVS